MKFEVNSAGLICTGGNLDKFIFFVVNKIIQGSICFNINFYFVNSKTVKFEFSYASFILERKAKKYKI